MDKKFYEAPEMEILKMNLGCGMLEGSIDNDDPGMGGEGDDEIIF